MKYYLYLILTCASLLHAAVPDQQEVPKWITIINKGLSIIEQQIKAGNLSLQLDEEKINYACNTIENNNKQIRNQLIMHLAKIAPQYLNLPFDNEEELYRKLDLIDQRIASLRKKFTPLILSALRLLEYNIKAGNVHLSVDEHTLKQAHKIATSIIRSLQQPAHKNLDASINNHLQQTMSSLLMFL